MRTLLLATVMTAGFSLGVLQAAEQEHAIAQATAKALARAEQAAPASAAVPVEHLTYDAPQGVAPLIPTAEAGPEPTLIDPHAGAPLTAVPESVLSGPSDPTDAREMLRQAAMGASLRVRAAHLVLGAGVDPYLAAVARDELRAAQADLESVRTLAEARDFSLTVNAFDAWHAAQVQRFREAGQFDEYALRVVLDDARANALRYFSAYAAAGTDPELQDYAARSVEALSRADYASIGGLTRG